jgi:hypothetical protein
MPQFRRGSIRLRTSTVLHGTSAAPGGPALVGVVTEVSSGGMRCAQYGPGTGPAIGERFHVVFVLPTGHIEGAAEVVWRQDDDWGMTLDPDPASRERLETFCAAPW